MAVFQYFCFLRNGSKMQMLRDNWYEYKNLNIKAPPQVLDGALEVLCQFPSQRNPNPGPDHQHGNLHHETGQGKHESRKSLFNENLFELLPLMQKLLDGSKSHARNGWNWAGFKGFCRFQPSLGLGPWRVGVVQNEGSTLHPVLAFPATWSGELNSHKFYRTYI